METLQTIKTTSPELLTSHIDSRLIKIRPMATPVDQISRHARQRHADSMKVDFYSVDMLPTKTHITDGDIVVPSRTTELTLTTVDHNVFNISDTVLISHPIDQNGNCATGYVTRTKDNSVTLKLILPEGFNTEFEIPDGTPLVRMARAALELDVQTAPYSSIPKKDYNLCQIFKTQVEQSNLLKLASKEIDWTLSDQEEAAIIDMRQAMERNFLFGIRNRLQDSSGEIITTGGIWKQPAKTFVYDDLSRQEINQMFKEAFTGNNGSSRKILIAGTGFITRLQNQEVVRVLTNEQKRSVWGLDFTEMITKFGSLYVIPSETFDQCCHEDDALIIDPEYLVKYSHIPFNVQKIDLRSSGTRNAEAVVATEASCLVLRYPQAHLRVTKRRTPQEN